MNKKVIKLTKSDLHRIINESLNKVINEGSADRSVDEMWIEAQSLMGADSMLDALYSYLDGDTIRDFLETLINEYELPLGKY